MQQFNFRSCSWEVFRKVLVFETFRKVRWNTPRLSLFLVMIHLLTSSFTKRKISTCLHEVSKFQCFFFCKTQVKECVWNNLFKNTPSKICGIQALKNLGLLKQTVWFKSFKGYIPKILLGPFLNTLSHL